MTPTQYTLSHSRSTDNHSQLDFYRLSASHQGDVFLFSPGLCSRNSEDSTSQASASFDGLSYTYSPANDLNIGAKILSPSLLPGNCSSSRSPLFIEAYLTGLEPKLISRSSPGTPFEQLFKSSPAGFWHIDENPISPISRKSAFLADLCEELVEEDECDAEFSGSGKGKIKSLLEYEKAHSVPESPAHRPSTPSSLSSLSDIDSSPSALFSVERHSSSQTSHGRTSYFSSPARTDEAIHASVSPLGSPFKLSASSQVLGSPGPSTRRHRRVPPLNELALPRRSLASEILNQLGSRIGRPRVGASHSVDKSAPSPTGVSDVDSEDENYEPSGSKSRKRVRNKGKLTYSLRKRQKMLTSVSAPTPASTPVFISQTQVVGEDDAATAETVNTPQTYPNRTFPRHIPIHGKFPLFYRRFPVSSVVDHELAAAHNIRKTPVPDGTWNEPRDLFDLYTPRFVKGKGTSKVGLCPICHESVARGGEGKKLWLSMKFSAFNYHMQYYHGISASTGRPFSPPVAFRTVSRPTAGKHEKTRLMEGKCHRCTKWVPVEGIKDVEAKVREIFWWKHAAGCHQGDTLEGEADVFVEDAVWRAVVRVGECFEAAR